MSRICFIEPPYGQFMERLDAPFALMYLAAVAEQNGWEAQIVEMHSLRDKLPNADIYAVTSSSPQFPATIKLEARLGDEFPDSLRIIGGNHISAEPKDLFKTNFNIGVLGEGETALVKILHRAAKSKSSTCVGMRGTPIDNLDEIPFPARHLVDWSKYKRGIYWGKELLAPAVSAISSRGCPFRCVFCLPKGSLVLNWQLEWIPIESVRKNDYVVGFERDKRTGRLKSVRSQVYKTNQRKANEIYKITTENGAVYSTAEHPWLTTHNRWRKASQLKKGWSLRNISQPIQRIPDSQEYKQGYIAGAFAGDGYIRHRKRSSEARLVGDFEMMDAVIEFSTSLDLNLKRRKFNGGHCFKNLTYCAVTYVKKAVDEIERFRDLECDNIEFLRGYVAGIYDAEGHFDATIRIFSKDHSLRQRIMKRLEMFDFKTTEEKDGVRIFGGTQSNIRFMSIFRPKATRKKDFSGYQLYNQSKILSIEKMEGTTESEVFNLSTSTENFVADGFVTHNCGSNVIFGRHTRFRSLTNVLEEVQQVKETLGYRGFNWHDDTFCLDKSRIANLCKYFEKMDIVWRCLSRADTMNEKLLEKMQKGGCKEIILGVESGSQKVLDRMCKGTNVKQNLEAMKMIKKAGIQLKTGIMVGSPSETWETVRETEKLLKECPPDFWNVSVFTPFPGSAVWKNPSYYGIKILTKDLSQYSMVGKNYKGIVVSETEAMKKADIEQARDELIDLLMEIAPP